MNKTRIEWVDYTWNPLTGCKTGCTYCYARRIAERFAGSKAFPRGFEPTFHPERLDEPMKLKKSSRILVCSMADLFGPWVSEEHWKTIVTATWADWLARRHTYFFLTKFPERYPRWSSLAARVGWSYWAGTTVENQDAAERRVDHLMLSKALCNYVSCEPLLGPVSLRRWNAVDWVIIGAMTGPGAVKPERRWVEDLVRECDERQIPVFCKDNLRSFCSEEFWRREKL